MISLLYTLFKAAPEPKTILAASIINDPKGEQPYKVEAVTDLINRLQGMVFAAAGGIAVGMIIYGGIIFLTAGGSEERVSKGKKILTFAFGGLLLIFMASFLIRFFVNILGGEIK